MKSIRTHLLQLSGRVNSIASNCKLKLDNLFFCLRVVSPEVCATHLRFEFQRGEAQNSPQLSILPCAEGQECRKITSVSWPLSWFRTPGTFKLLPTFVVAIRSSWHIFIMSCLQIWNTLITLNSLSLCGQRSRRHEKIADTATSQNAAFNLELVVINAL